VSREAAGWLIQSANTDGVIVDLPRVRKANCILVSLVVFHRGGRMSAVHAFRRYLRPVVAVLAIGTAAPAAQTNEAPARYTALAVNMGSPVRWKSLTVEMVVNRWSTDAERDRLIRVAFDQGSDKLLDVLRDMPRVGYLRTPDSIGYDLRFARKVPGEDGGERVTLATDRYIGFWEAANRPRTIDYPFTIIELRIAPSGKGEGKMSLFARIIPDKANNPIVLEDYGTQPLLLQGLKREPL
jgi:hypothetical protein